MIGWGICYHGLSKLLVLDGTLNELAYGQALLHYQEDNKFLEKKVEKILFLNKMGQKPILVKQILIY